MCHIKKFEDFDFSQTLMVTSKNVLNSHYSCDECDSLWKEFNTNCTKCKFCESTEIEELSEDEWYDIAKSRLGEDEFNEVGEERMRDSNYFIDLSDESDMYNDENIN